MEVSIGKSALSSVLSIAMFDYQRVSRVLFPKQLLLSKLLRRLHSMKRWKVTMCKAWALSCLDRQSKTGRWDIQDVSVNSSRKLGVSSYACWFESSFWARPEAHSADAWNPKGGEVPAGGRFCSLGRLHAAACSWLHIVKSFATR